MDLTEQSQITDQWHNQTFESGQGGVWGKGAGGLTGLTWRWGWGASESYQEITLK